MSTTLDNLGILENLNLEIKNQIHRFISKQRKIQQHLIILIEIIVIICTSKWSSKKQYEINWIYKG